MVAPTVALRFRDTTPGIDTIEEHLKILKKCGSVWWGWWKKEFENDHADFFRSADDFMDIFIVDRSTQRMFSAKSSERIFTKGGAPNPDLVPPYYQHSAKEVFGWFKLTSIETADYSPKIANLFGDNTVVIANQTKEREEVTIVEQKNNPNQSSILILSDLHLGSDYDYLKQGQSAEIGNTKGTLTDCIVADLARIGLRDDIGSIIITGDFTSNGSWEESDIKDITSEFSALTSALSIDRNSLICIPGNHDVVRYPSTWEGDPAKLAVSNQVSLKHERDFRVFLNTLQGREFKHPLDYIEKVRLKEADILVGALNSCRIVSTNWTEYGYAGQSGIDIIKQLGSEKIDRPTFKVVAIHHHLLPVNQVEAPKKNGVTLSLDASRILEASQASGVHIALHGHQHMPHLASYQSLPGVGQEQSAGLTVVSNGSVGVAATRRPGEERNTYCVLTFSRDSIRLKMRELRSDQKSGNYLYDLTIDAKPAMPS